MPSLRIYDRRERRLVAAADALLAPLALARRFRRAAAEPPARVLCFRIERIGDLLMTLPALAALRAALPGASIDLAVGSWNRDVAMAIPGIDRIETLDAAWLARPSGDGRSGLGLVALARRTAAWRGRRYDLAINFEPDIRTNLAMAAAGARRTAGFSSGGGGALLDVALDYDPASHTADNALRLVEAAVGDLPPEGGNYRPDSQDLPREGGNYRRDSQDVPPEGGNYRPDSQDVPPEGGSYRPDSQDLPPEGGGRSTDPVASAFRRNSLDPRKSLLQIPDAARAEAASLLRRFEGSLRIGMHVSGGRAIKQWPETRFRDVAAALVRDRGAAIVLTGTPGERAQTAIVREALPADRVLDLSGGADLLTVAAVLQQLDLVVTGDTGPMHLAHAVGTPIVAVFGPSDPARYAPRGPRDRVVRIDLPCSPCNRIRLPPARCVGHTPDCLAGIDTASVLAAIDETLDGGRR